MTTMTDDAALSAGRVPLKTPWLLIVAIALATLGVAAGLAWRPDSPPPVDAVRAQAVSADAKARAPADTPRVAPGAAQEAKGTEARRTPAN